MPKSWCCAWISSSGSQTVWALVKVGREAVTLQWRVSSQHHPVTFSVSVGGQTTIKEELWLVGGGVYRLICRVFLQYCTVTGAAE